MSVVAKISFVQLIHSYTVSYAEVIPHVRQLCSMCSCCKTGASHSSSWPSLLIILSLLLSQLLLLVPLPLIRFLDFGFWVRHYNRGFT
jgi:hypothetical protein